MVLSLLFFHNLTRHKNGGQSLKRSHDLSLSEADSWKLHAALEVARSPLCQEPKRTFRQGLPASLSPGQPQPFLSPLCPSAWGAPEQTTLGLFRSIRLCHMRADMSMHRACTVPCSCGRGASTLPGVSSVSRASTSSLSVCRHRRQKVYQPENTRRWHSAPALRQRRSRFPTAQCPHVMQGAFCSGDTASTFF